MKLSLTTRLTTLFAVVSATILIVLGFIIKSSIEQHFEQQDYAELSDKIQQTSQLLRNQSVTGVGLSRDQLIEQATLDHADILIRIQTLDGKVLFASAPQPLPEGLSDVLALNNHSLRYTWQQENIHYRAMARLITQIEPRPSLIIMASISTTRHSTFLQHFSQALSGMVILAIMISALLGWLTARQGLAPLRLMRHKARSITATRLNQRLPAEAIPQELAGLAEELNLMFDRLEASFQRLTHFSSDIAHELRTPVSNLMTQSQVCLSQPRSDEDYREILASNLEEFDKLSRMISDMLFLAKAEHGLALPNQETFALAAEIHKLIDFYGILAEEKSINLQLQGDAEVTGDKLMLDRAISNLITNAIRHTPDNGWIRIEIETTEQEVRLQVCNNGDTISQADLPFLFDRFYRCDQARSGNQKEGAGLGLAIVKAIIESHMGVIEVSSAEQRTCFTVRLPVPADH